MSECVRGCVHVGERGSVPAQPRVAGLQRTGGGVALVRGRGQCEVRRSAA